MHMHINHPGDQIKSMQVYYFARFGCLYVIGNTRDMAVCDSDIRDPVNLIFRIDDVSALEQDVEFR